MWQGTGCWEITVGWRSSTSGMLACTWEELEFPLDALCAIQCAHTELNRVY
jgi:hypothetical protein